METLADELFAGWLKGHRAMVARQIVNHETPAALTALVASRFQFGDAERRAFELRSLYAFLLRIEHGNNEAAKYGALAKG